MIKKKSHGMKKTCIKVIKFERYEWQKSFNGTKKFQKPFLKNVF